MQGIQLFEYRSLKESLHKLQQSETILSSSEHAEIIAAHEKKLKEIYSNYRLVLDELSHVINQFEDHKLSIRRLAVKHKQYKRKMKVKLI